MSESEREREREREREMPHKCTLLNDTSAVNYVRVVMVALFNYLTVSITISNDHKSPAGALSLSHAHTLSHSYTHTHTLSHAIATK